MIIVTFSRSCKPTRWTGIRLTSPTIDEEEIKVVDLDSGRTSTTRETLYMPSRKMHQPTVSALVNENKSKSRKQYTQIFKTQKV